ncbi:IS110 family transposase [Mesorhizobium sp. M0904]|uniref:transposase n=1 Tax=unclassified Mesorhizobium TaxID=325217 RepID=UPI00333CEBB8
MGLAPIANDSGRRSGRRPVRGGRKGPRSILFLIALTVARYDPPAPSDRKGKMTIRIAPARKLPIIPNAKARDARHEFANAT